MRFDSKGLIGLSEIPVALKGKCIHQDFNFDTGEFGDVCGRPADITKPNGYLCVGHDQIVFRHNEIGTPR